MIKHTYPGKFIVIEGLDGSGKSSQVELAVNFLKEQGKEVIVTKEPTMDSEYGLQIRRVLKGEITKEPLELQKLYVDDRREHLKNKVIPALGKGKYVVSSRYYFSTFAYGGSEGLDVNMLIEMNKEFLVPDLAIIIDSSPENCIQRIEKRGEGIDYFEKIEKLKRINEFYKKMPGMFEHVILVNGERPISQVSQEIKSLLEKLS